MRHRPMLTAAALLMMATAAQATHYEYQLDLSGTYSLGGPQGCSAADTSGCPLSGSLQGLLSFSTPDNGDGSWTIEADYGDITDFHVSLGFLPSDVLYGGIDVIGGAPNGSVQSSPPGETFTFDWATRTVEYSYDFGDHAPNGSYSGTLQAIPEAPTSGLMLAGLILLGNGMRRRSKLISPRLSSRRTG